jgi:uncharacterized protein (DUF433 family)
MSRYIDCIAMTLKDLESSLASLTRAEKAEVLQRLAQDVANAWSGIDCKPGVAGGDACIVRTRIPVWTLENYRRLGWSESLILDNFPVLRAADVVNAWAYVDAHRAEIDRAIEENESV